MTNHIMSYLNFETYTAIKFWGSSKIDVKFSFYHMRVEFSKFDQGIYRGHMEY